MWGSVMPNKKFQFAMTVDDVALAHWYCEKNFRNLIAFFDENGVKATFFVVPVDEESEKPFYEVFPELPEIIKAARANGHAFGQHGIRHNRFELGVPPAMVLDLPHETENKRYAAENKEALAADHCVENCRARLKQGRKAEAAEAIYLAGMETPDDPSFSKEALKMLLGLEEYEKMARLLEYMTDEVRQKPLIRFMESCICAHTGKLDEALAILMENGGLNVPDIREGENSTSQLYIFIQQKKAEAAGLPFDPAKVDVPFAIDLRMS